MKCSCCGRKKKLFESFEDLGKGGNVCVDCSDIMYRIHDAVTANQKEEYEKNVKKINSFIDKKKASSEFGNWFKNDFIKRNSLKEK